MEELIGTFTATDDVGQIHTLHIIQDYANAGTLKDPHARIPGRKSIRTSEGEAVNRLEKGRYEIVGGLILKTEDPDAP